jgi:hypothetical protein
MRDLKYALRVLVKAPAFTATAVLTLGLCIGANTAIYTVVDRLLLRPLPYPQPDRLAQVVTHSDRTGDDAVGSRQVMIAASVPGLTLAAAGVAIGGVAARAAALTLRHLVWGVSVGDPTTFAVAIASVLTVAALAVLMPALTITRLNPIRALRQA